MYSAREEFYPSSYVPALYGKVSYTVIMDRDGENYTQCHNDENDPVNITELSSIPREFVWSDSGLLAKIQPNTLGLFQLELLLVAFKQVGVITYLTNSKSPSLISLDLTLNITSLPCIPSDRLLNETLKDLTSWVSQSLSTTLFALAGV